MKNLTVYIDGASKGNPGQASIGLVIYSDNKPLKKVGAPIGIATNNVAEYMALITALVECKKFSPEQIEIKSDSLLLVSQMQGKYKVKDAWLQKLHFIAKRLASGYNNIVFKHIVREENTQADRIANESINKDTGQLF